MTASFLKLMTGDYLLETDSTSKFILAFGFGGMPLKPVLHDVRLNVPNSERFVRIRVRGLYSN